MKMEMSVQDVLRAQGVKRWHIVETVRPQSLAEHQWNVAAITDAICRYMDYPAENRMHMVARAMFHDIDEVLHGDVPSPVKGGPKSYSEDKGGSIVKLADLIEAWWFINEFGVGRNAQRVKLDCHDRLMKFARQEGVVMVNIAKAMMERLSTGEFTA